MKQIFAQDLLLKAIESVPDLTELDIVLFLCAVLPTSRPDVMDVDVSSGPTLEQALASCVRAPWSNGPLRLAIHQCMKDPEGVVKILEVIASWIEGCAVGFIEEDTDVPPLDQVCIPLSKYHFLCYATADYLIS